MIDQKSGKLVTYDTKNITPSLTASHNGHQTVFYHMIEKYLSDEFSPESVSERTGINKAGKIRAIATEIARVAFEESFEIAEPWTDFRGKKHKTMVARPVSFHAMRNISIPMDSKLVGLYMSCKLFLERLKFLEAFDLSLLTLNEFDTSKTTL